MILLTDWLKGTVLNENLQRFYHSKDITIQIQKYKTE